MENPRKNGVSYEFGAFRLDAGARVLFRDGDAVPLAPKVVETLVALVERGGELMTKDELMERLWPDTFVEEANLTQNIFMLRKALGEVEYIETVPRRGYRFLREGRRSGRAAAGSELTLTRRTRTRVLREEEETTEDGPEAAAGRPAAGSAASVSAPSPAAGAYSRARQAAVRATLAALLLAAGF